MLQEDFHLAMVRYQIVAQKVTIGVVNKAYQLKPLTYISLVPIAVFPAAGVKRLVCQSGA